MCHCPLFFFLLFFNELTLPSNYSPTVFRHGFSAVFLLYSFSHLTLIGLSLRSHLAITAAGSFEHLLSLSTLSILLFSFCHFDDSVFFEAQAINLCCSAPTKISQFQGRRWREVWMVMGGVSPVRIDPASPNVLSDTAGSHHKHP